MASMKQIVCACGCGATKMVRTADIKRGWGKYATKRCKARAQERRTHQNRDYKARLAERDSGEDWGHPFEAGYGGHGQH